MSSSILKKLDVIIVHIETNDSSKGVNTIQKVKKFVESIKELDRDESINTGFSSIINRGDVDKQYDVKKVNYLLQKFCESKRLLFMCNSNINLSCLNKSKLHLNRKGTSLLSRNFRNTISSYL